MTRSAPLLSAVVVAALASSSCNGTLAQRRRAAARTAPRGALWAAAPRGACPGSYDVEGRRALASFDGASNRRAGLAASAAAADRSWLVVDDSLTALTTTGEVAGVLRFDVDGAVLPDIAAAPCPDFTGACLWAIVDDDGARTLMSFPEPVDVDAGDAPPLAPSYRYPLADVDGLDRPAALVVLPDVSAVIVVDEEGAPFAVRAPLVVDGTNAPVPLAPLPLPAAAAGPVRAAELDASSPRLVVRTEAGVVEWRLDDARQALALPDTGVLVDDEGGSGAIAYAPGGDGLIGTVDDGDAATLVQWPCK